MFRLLLQFGLLLGKATLRGLCLFLTQSAEQDGHLFEQDLFHDGLQRIRPEVVVHSGFHRVLDVHELVHSFLKGVPSLLQAAKRFLSLAKPSFHGNYL